jgi:hypothetical protein
MAPNNTNAGDISGIASSLKGLYDYQAQLTVLSNEFSAAIAGQTTVKDAGNKVR